eukprot:674254-Pelagomonas_calceolata.AAC.1
MLTLVCTSSAVFSAQLVGLSCMCLLRRPVALSSCCCVLKAIFGMREQAEETGSWLWLIKSCAKTRTFDDVDGQHAVCLLRLDWAHKEVVQSAFLGRFG